MKTIYLCCLDLTDRLKINMETENTHLKGTLPESGRDTFPNLRSISSVSESLFEVFEFSLCQMSSHNCLNPSLSRSFLISFLTEVEAFRHIDL